MGLNLSAYQISIIFQFAAELLLLYFRFRKTDVRHIEILLRICRIHPQQHRKLHWRTKFHRNRSTHGGVMTLYWFYWFFFQDDRYGVASVLLVAGLVTQLVWGRANFRRDISIDGWVITTSGFGKQTAGLQSHPKRHFCIMPFIITPSFVDMWPFTPKLVAFI